MADFKRDIQTYGGINPQTGCMLLRGNIRMLGYGSALSQLSVGDLDVSGNVSFDSLLIAGNITSGRNFIGNGALMTDVTSTLPSRGNIDIIGNVVAPGNVNAEYFIGDGSQLTGITGVTATLPPIISADIRGNIIGAYANLSNLILSSSSIALGELAGSINQQVYTVAIGSEAGTNNQGGASIAMGLSSGATDQGNLSVAVGAYSGYSLQGENSVGVGASAGSINQGVESVAIGARAGQYYQENLALAIGTGAGESGQGTNSVAIGAGSGNFNQGPRSISIGAYGTTQGANSILINATGDVVVTSESDTFVVKPIRGDVGNVNKLVMYDTSSGEITYNTSGYIGNVVTGQVNVTGNVVLSPGKSVFASQMPFFWSSPIHGNPATGANLIVTGAMADSATYINAQTGVRLTTTTNAQTGSIRWNVTDFDFTKDFNVRACIYMSSNADGIWVGVGASNPGTGVNYANGNGGLAMRLWTYVYNYTIMYGTNGLPIGQTQNNNGNLVNEWLTVDTTVRTIGSRKYLHIFAKNALQNAVDVTGWAPGGNYIYVGASTGGANANHYVNYIDVKYI